MFRLRSHILLPLGACAFAAGLNTVSGACKVSTSPPPSLQTGRYILVGANGRVLPFTFNDAMGRQIRVIADTLTFNPGQTYSEAATIAITPSGGVEQPPTSFAISTRAYTVPAEARFELPATVGGAAHGFVVSGDAINLQMPDNSTWAYTHR